MASAAMPRGRRKRCRCCRHRNNKIAPGELLHKGDMIVHDKLGSVHSSSQIGLTDTIYETLDELDEFAMESGRQGSIQEGENPPFMASSDSLSGAASYTQTRSLGSQLLSSQILSSRYQERIQTTSSTQDQRRPRLVRMEDVVEKLWDKAAEPKKEENLPIQESMRASFYRPSMIQSTRRTDIDLTATWHGDISATEMVDPIVDVYTASHRGGYREDSFAGSLFSRESSSNLSQSHGKADFLSTFGHPLFTAGSEDASKPFGKTSMSARTSQDRFKGSSLISTSFRKMRLRLRQPSDAVSPRKPRWSWARCVDSLKKLKKGLRMSRESSVMRKADSSRPPLPARHVPRRGTKECLSCLGPSAGSDISSYDLDFRGHVPMNPVHEAPFLTTSALFDDPSSPPSCSASDSFMFYKMSASNIPKMSARDVLTIPEHVHKSSKEDVDLAELWEDSDVGSVHDVGSYLMNKHCWVPPVLKTDKEYEATRTCGNKVIRGPHEFGTYEPALTTQYNRMSSALERQFSALSSKSSWDIHSVNIDRTHFESTFYRDPQL